MGSFPIRCALERMVMKQIYLPAYQGGELRGVGDGGGGAPVIQKQGQSKTYTLLSLEGEIHICFLYAQWLSKEALEGFGDFKIGGQIIHTVKYADDLVLPAKEVKVLQDMNVEKPKVMRISRQPFPVKIMMDQKARECGIF